MTNNSQSTNKLLGSLAQLIHEFETIVESIFAMLPFGDYFYFNFSDLASMAQMEALDSLFCVMQQITWLDFAKLNPHKECLDDQNSSIESNVSLSNGLKICVCKALCKFCAYRRKFPQISKTSHWEIWEHCIAGLVLEAPLSYNVC